MTKKNKVIGYICRRGNCIRKDIFIGTPYNIANYIMYNYMYDVIITDEFDNLIISSIVGGYIELVKDKTLRLKVVKHMNRIQNGDKCAVDIVESLL